MPVLRKAPRGAACPSWCAAVAAAPAIPITHASNDAPAASTSLRAAARRFRTVAGLFSLIALSGCASLPPVASSVEPRPLGRDLAIARPSATSGGAFANTDTTSAAGSTQSVADPAVPARPLTLRQALATALQNNPELSAFAWKLRAADARALQAGLWPNPEFSVESENFAGTGAYNGLSALETTAWISQRIPTGGEIAKRTRIAELERTLSAWDYEAKRLDVFTEVAQRFVGVLAAQRLLEVDQKSFDLANEVYRTISSQVAAGAISPIEKTRASAERARTRVELRRARHALEAAKIALAGPLGLAEPDFDKVVGALEATQPVPPLSTLYGFLGENPAIARGETALAKGQAEIDLARAERIPDVTIGIGVRRFRAFDDTAVVASLSVPLPLFDRNQGNIQAARAELGAARSQRRATRVRTRAALGQRYQELLAARQAAAGLKGEALPAARDAYEAVRTAYRYGQRGFLDVLVARRTLFEVESRYIETLAEYHRAVAAVERLIARPLDAATAKGMASPASSNPIDTGDTP